MSERNNEFSSISMLPTELDREGGHENAAHQSRTYNAREVLNSCRIPIGADFNTLSAAQVDKLLSYANANFLRKWKLARMPAWSTSEERKRSRARNFHDLMQRRAR